MKKVKLRKNELPPSLRRKKPQRLYGHSHELTMLLARRVCRRIVQGLPLSVALDHLCIPHHRYVEWMRQSEEVVGVRKKTAQQQLAVKCIRMIRRAQAEYQLRLVKGLHKAKNKMWQRELQILERRDKKHWSKYEPQNTTGIEEYDPDERFL